MDGARFGRLVRAVRQRERRTQQEVGGRAGVSQSVVGRIERGELAHVSIPSIERVAGALEITLRLDARWRGGDGDRLIDREHAAVVELTVASLRRTGWEPLVEYTFNHFGERGSVDVIGWHPSARALVLVEVKSRLTDIQDLLSTFGRKARIVPELLATERGWEAVTIGRLIVLPGSRANRAIVDRHRAIFDTTFPGRASDVRSWLRDPRRPLASLWFITPDRVAPPPRVERVRMSEPPRSGGGARQARREVDRVTDRRSRPIDGPDR